MPKRSVISLFVCILLIVSQLTGCVEIKVQQPESQDDSTSRAGQAQEDQTSGPDQTVSDEPVSAAEGEEVAELAEAWVEYTEDYGGLSFRYPKGWNVEMNESVVAIDNEKTNEQMIMAMIPFIEGNDPTALASGFVAMLQTENPNLEAANWRTNPQTSDSQVVFDLSDEVNGNKYSGTGIVMKDSQQAIWFSYFSPESAYSYDRSIELLKNFIGSLATASGSKDRNTINSSESASKIDANAKGFIFVLEFALGAPFTADQEQVILEELKDGWSSLTEEELSKYDQYPIFAKAILTMNQGELDEMRAELEKAIKEWLDESPDTDEAVRMIKDQLNARGREVITGDPPLTEMSLTAYSEIIAYSRLLHQNPEAMPEQISPDSVYDIKNQVQESWETFSNEEQQQIATSPGIWFCLRTLVNNGSKGEQDKIRKDLVKLTPETQATKDSNESGNGKKPMSMAAHNSLMNIQQMTFNQYMWSRGFNYHPTYGKMW